MTPIPLRTFGSAFGCAVAALALLLTPGCKKHEKAIAVIPKGTTHTFWKAVEAGAVRAGKDLGIKIIWKGPLKEDDKAGQIGMVEDFANDPDVVGICLAPLDDTALLGPVQAANAKKPVVLFDSGLKGQAGKDFASLVATDNKKGGRMAGEEMVRLLGGKEAKGKIVLLRYKEGHASTGDREAGFMEVFGDPDDHGNSPKYPDVRFLEWKRFGGATSGESQTAATNLIDKLKEADGVFCPNESSTDGMLKALEAEPALVEKLKSGKLSFIGFDTSPPLVEGLRQGEIKALVAQDPEKMGYEAVSTMAKRLKGETVPESIDTGAYLVTKDKLDDPQIKKLIGG